MDLRLLDAEPTAAERDAVDAFLGPPVSSWAGARPRSTNGHCRCTAATRRAPSAISCCRRCMRCRSGSDGSARARSNYIARRLTIPPADAYGVATFYALFSLEPRPPRVLHVCDDIVCRCAGSQSALIAALDEQVGPRAPTRRRQLDAEPVPGPVRPGAGGAAESSPASARSSAS